MNGAPERVRARSIKLTTGELVHACGGIEAAADIINKGKSQVHRCTSINDDTQFMGLRDAALLEAHAGAPLLTQLLAKLAGGVFLPLPDPELSGDHLPLQVCELADELGDVSRAVRDALRDGELSGKELATVEVELDQLIVKATEARAMVQLLQGNPPALAGRARTGEGGGREKPAPVTALHSRGEG